MIVFRTFGLLLFAAVLSLAGSAVEAKFEFVDVSRNPDPAKYKDVPNPPVFDAPLGACEVPYLSLKRVKRELMKRVIECTECQTKEDYQIRLRDAIKDDAPVMSDEDLERYVVYLQEKKQGGDGDSGNRPPTKDGEL